MSPEVVELQPQDAVAVRGEVSFDQLPAFFQRAFPAAACAANESGVDIVGPPFGCYPESPTENVTVEAGFAVSAPVGQHGDAHALVLPGGRAARAMHVGPYDTLARTYDELRAWMAEHGLRPGRVMWECYLSDPVAEPDPATWRTLIVWPVEEAAS